jgi:hypothetical protein
MENKTMDNTWPSIFINAAVVLALGGALWRLNIARLDQVQRWIETKVNVDYCGLQHQALHQDIRDIKAAQNRMARTLEEIRVNLAKENGRKQAMEDKK